VVRIDATAIVAAMANNIVITRQDPIQDAEDEAIGRHLSPMKPHFRASSVGVSMQPASVFVPSAIKKKARERASC
jgi:hypothetical protein